MHDNYSNKLEQGGEEKNKTKPRGKAWKTQRLYVSFDPISLPQENITQGMGGNNS